MPHLPDRKRRELERIAVILLDQMEDDRKTMPSEKTRRDTMTTEWFRR